MAFTAGMQIGKYELGKKLGEGGFGLVMVARDTNLDREVALKFMHAEHTANPDILRRFLQEARSAAKITHPGIVTVFECGQVAGTNTSADGVAYIAMELLHGESLSDRLSRSGRLDVDTAMEIGRQIASALDAAHRAGIVHRDLKPDNIYLVTDPAMPSGERVKVLDFGIAKLAQAAGSGVQTQSMMVFGTPRYMSPEQCKSAANIDHRSDIYALGCILFELVCGQPPFVGETGELIAKHQLVDPPIAREIFSDVPDGLDRLISLMLAKSPAARPQTMAEVQRALRDGGAISPGVAPTLLPDAVESLQRFTPPPGSLGRRPGSVGGSSRSAGSAQPAPSSQVAAAAVPNPTTLSGASGAWADDVARPKRRNTALLVGVVVAAAIGGVWFALRGTAEPSAPQTQVQPAPSPPPPAAAQPAAPKDIELTLSSTPKAEVYAVDGRLLGETPYTHTRAPADGKVVFVLRADGYQDLRVTMPADHDDTQALTLTALEPAVVAAPTPPPRIVPPKVGRAKPPIKDPNKDPNAGTGSATPPAAGSGSATKPAEPPGMGGRL
jgi:serine/threonine-protein kinase